MSTAQSSEKSRSDQSTTSSRAGAADHDPVRSGLRAIAARGPRFGEAPQQLFQNEAGLQPGQWCAEVAVDAAAEGHREWPVRRGCRSRLHGRVLLACGALQERTSASDRAYEKGQPFGAGAGVAGDLFVSAAVREDGLGAAEQVFRGKWTSPHLASLTRCEVERLSGNPLRPREVIALRLLP